MYTMQTNLVSRPLITASCRRLRIGADGGRLPSSGPHRVAVPHCRRPANLGRMKKHDYPKSYRLEDTSPVTTHRSCRLEEDAAMVNAADKHTKSTRKDKFFEVEMRVRDDDLDEYGVVNNAVYASYIHDARNVLLETLGFNIHLWTSTGNTMALSELHLKYFTPLRSGGRFIVKLRVVQIKGVRIIVNHVIETLPNRKVVMEASATAVCLDKNHRPTRVFPDLVSKINQFFPCENNSS